MRFDGSFRIDERSLGFFDLERKRFDRDVFRIWEITDFFPLRKEESRVYGIKIEFSVVDLERFALSWKENVFVGRD
jgi:hypothetical protein